MPIQRCRIDAKLMKRKKAMTLEDEIIAAEARRFNAIMRPDAAKLREGLDEELVYVHTNGVIEDPETFIAKLVSSARKYLNFKAGAHTIRQLGSVVACIGKIEVESRNGAMRVVATSVYQRRDGSPRKMVLWHACSVKRA